MRSTILVLGAAACSSSEKAAPEARPPIDAPAPRPSIDANTMPDAVPSCVAGDPFAEAPLRERVSYLASKELAGRGVARLRIAETDHAGDLSSKQLEAAAEEPGLPVGGNVVASARVAVCGGRLFGSLLPVGPGVARRKPAAWRA